MDGWLTIEQIAQDAGVAARDVDQALGLIGLRDSKINGRGEGRAREYSPGAVCLVKRELKARGRLPKVGGK